MGVLAFTLKAVHEVRTNRQQIQLKEIKLRNIQAELNKLDSDYRMLEEDKTKSEAEKQAEIERLKQREDELQKQIEARRLIKEQEARVYAAEAQKPAVVAQNASGTCEAWIAAAGITDLASARELIRRESGCNPNAVNRSSGACGVAQELSCGKSGCSTPPNGDGACQVAWMNKYTLSRYGSWAAAVAFHDRNNWY